jgi:hypothetical protein
MSGGIKVPDRFVFSLFRIHYTIKVMILFLYINLSESFLMQAHGHASLPGLHFPVFPGIINAEV